MKNSLIILILSCAIFIGQAFAQSFTFETKSLEITENGNVIYANDGKAYSSDKDLEIIADKF